MFEEMTHEFSKWAEPLAAARHASARGSFDRYFSPEWETLDDRCLSPGIDGVALILRGKEIQEALHFGT